LEPTGATLGDFAAGVAERHAILAEPSVASYGFDEKGVILATAVILSEGGKAADGLE
jgi:hypothetical protein